MFIAALFTIARTWKQPKCLSTDEWIKKMLYIIMEQFLAIKKNEILPFVKTGMELEGKGISDAGEGKFAVRVESELPVAIKDI